jgi:hypothetical protein
MTNMEHTELQQIRTDMKGMSVKVDSMGGKVDEMYDALMGSRIGKDGGLVGRIEDLELITDKHSKSIVELNEKNVKVEVYQKIMWGCVGGVAAMLFTYVINLLIK